MNRSLIALVVISLFLAACATTTAPVVSGTISKIEGSTLTVTPANGGQPTEVVVNWGTRVYYPNGLAADGASVLSLGQPVQVYLENGSKTASRINIAQ